MRAKTLNGNRPVPPDEINLKILYKELIYFPRPELSIRPQILELHLNEIGFRVWKDDRP